MKDDYGLSGKDEGAKVTPVLDWVYGYRGKDSRANLDKLPTGEVSKIGWYNWIDTMRSHALTD